MEILIPDTTRFGVMEKGKLLRPTSNGLYLITNGEHPDKTDKAIVTAEVSYVMAQKVAKAKAVSQHLGSKQPKVWNINCAESKRTKTVVWQECDRKEVDYNTEETLQLVDELKRLRWASSIRVRAAFCDLLGVSFSNYRNITASLNDREDKPVTRMSPSSISFFLQAIDEYQNANITLSTKEQPNQSLEDAFRKLGQGGVDEQGYTIWQMTNKKPSSSLITKGDTYIVRLKGEKRDVIEEAVRGKEPSGFDISNPLLRVHTKEGLKYFLHAALITNVGLWKVLKIQNPDLFDDKLAELDLTDKPLGASLSDFYGKGEYPHTDPMILEKIRELDTEVLTLNNTWEKIDLTKHSAIMTNLITDFDLTDNSKFESSDGHIFKETYSKNKFGFTGFSTHLLLPLVSRHSPIRQEPKNYYWMKWCLGNDVSFKQYER